MKKILCLISALVIVLTAAGCTVKEESEMQPEKVSSSIVETTKEETTDVSETEEVSTEIISELEKDSEETVRVISYLGNPANGNIYFSGNPCADGGYLFEYDGHRGISFSADDENGILRNAYIIGTHQEIVPDINTGGDYDMYRRHVKGLSALRYDTSCFSYCADLEYEYEGSTYYVTMYFSDGGAECIGATVSLDKLHGQYTGANERTGAFLLEYVGKPLGEAKDFCKKSSTEIGWDATYSAGNGTVDITVGASFEDEKVGEDDVIKCINVFDGAETALLPGITIENFEAFAKELGFEESDDNNPEKSMYGVFRVGPANIETYVEFFENDESKIASIKFICKPLCR